MNPIKTKSLQVVVGSMAAGGLTAHLCTSAHFKQGIFFGMLNGLAVSAVSPNENRGLYSIGAIALIIICARAVSPKLQGRVEIPTGKALVILALPTALYACVFPYSPSSKGKPTESDTSTTSSTTNTLPQTTPQHGQPGDTSGQRKSPEFGTLTLSPSTHNLPRKLPTTHKHKRPGYVSGKGKPSEARMQANFMKGVIEHHEDDPKAYISAEEVKAFQPFEGKLTLQADADTQLGTRSSNEDAHCTHTFENGSRLFGVFDGHGGIGASNLAQQKGPYLFQQQLQAQKGDILKAFEGTMEVLHQLITDRSGSTVVMCYFDPQTNRVYTATLADAEANIYRQSGDTLKSIPLSPVRNWKTDEKHLPPDSVAKFGSQDPKHWRVNGTDGALNLSRAIGDKGFPLVSQKPKVTMTQLLPGDTLVLCCDGLKDFVPESEIVETIREGADQDAQTLAQALTKKSVEKQSARHGDNVTVIVVKVKE
ncbi:MAG: protein phosphatase 2C family protein [Chlamydiales bacterium]|nr:protein phosphatase 2C family protein [Chlamydiales bacterium]